MTGAFLIEQTKPATGRWQRRMTLNDLGLRGPGSQVIVLNVPVVKTMLRIVQALVTISELPLSDPAKKLGENIRRRRQEIGMTQFELAIKCERRLDTISKIENGKSHPSRVLLYSIQASLHIRVAELIDATPKAPVKAERQRKCYDYL